MAPTVRDRTVEFRVTVESFQQIGYHSLSNKNCSSSSTLSKNHHEQSSRIRHLADQIQQSITDIENKIVELENLAKITTNFNDKRPEIISLISTSSTDIDSLTLNIKTLTSFLKQSFDGLSSNHHCINHHKSLSLLLQTRYSKLTASFSRACELSTFHLQRQQKEKEKLNGGIRKRIYHKRPINRIQKASNNENRLVLRGNYQSQMQLQCNKEAEYNEQRAIEAQHIEQQITEISQMMQQIAVAVEEQKRYLDGIDRNVVKSTDYVTKTIEELTKYLANLNGNRWLMMKVFALLIFFSIIFTVFIA